jgi:hypothetical protein
MRKILALTAMALLCAAPMAGAAPLVIDLTVPDAALVPYSSPYGTVTIDLTSATTATVTFAAWPSSTYLFGGAGSTDLNVNATGFTATGLTGYTTPTISYFSNGAVSQFGKLNLQIDNFDGFGDASTPMSFLLTNTGGTWSSVNDVLVNDATGYMAAGHIFVPNATGSAAIMTGFAGNGEIPAVPEPASMLLLGSGLLGAGWFGRRRKM